MNRSRQVKVQPTRRRQRRTIPEKRTFGSEIRGLRETHGWSREEFSELLETKLRTTDHLAYDDAWIARMERNEVRWYPLERLQALFDVLDCDLEQRVRLLLLANRSVLTDSPDDVTDVVVWYHCLLKDITDRALQFILDNLPHERRIPHLGDSDWNMIGLAAIMMAAQHRFLEVTKNHAVLNDVFQQMISSLFPKQPTATIPIITIRPEDQSEVQQ